MAKFKNISDMVQTVPNLGEFKPGETTPEVDELNNPNFEKVGVQPVQQPATIPSTATETKPEDNK